MTKPSRATPGGRNRRILANGRSSGRSTTRWPPWNVRRTARIVPVSAAGPASARGVPSELRVAGGAAGHPDPAGVADGRLPGCQQADSRDAGCVTVPSGLAGQPGGSWSFPAGNHDGGPLLSRRGRRGAPGPGGGIEMVWFWLGPGAGFRSRRSSRTRSGDRSGPIVTTSSPPDRSRPPRLAAASPGWRHRPWRACRASGQRNGRGLRRWPRPAGMRAAPSMPRDAAGGPADPVLTRLRCGPAGPGGLRAVRRRLAAQRPAMPSAACGIGSNARPAVTPLVPGDRRLAGLMASAHAA